MKFHNLSILFLSLVALSSCTKDDPKEDAIVAFPEIDKLSETDSFGTLEISNHNSLNGTFNFVANTDNSEYDNFKGAHYAAEGDDFIEITAESVSENKEHFISCVIFMDEVDGVGVYSLADPIINRVSIKIYRFIEGQAPDLQSNMLADFQSIDGKITLREWNENGGIFSQGVDLTFEGSFEDSMSGDVVEIDSARILFQ